jgi:beta-glucosidase/6-phospho-beta-glucosidase/beta-galactosidase
MPFNGFLMGGFECSTHRDNRGRRLDLIASTRHEEFAEADYRRLLDLNIKTCRDGLRWHLIELEPFRYDFKSLEKQIEAARRTGIEVVWDFFHYGYPDDIDIFTTQFVERFESFCQAATAYLKSRLDGQLFVCPVNEISFFAWIAGQVGNFYPCVRHRGGVLKRQLVRAAVAGIRGIKSVDPTVRTLFTDPAIHVVPQSDKPSARRAAELYRRSQFEAFDMLAGRREPELGGTSETIDIIGLNYYFHNQWHHPSRRKIPLGHEVYRPLADILREFHQRYDKPLVIAETGIEDDERPEWFRYVCEQTTLARTSGVDVNGICLYPIVNHPGWADDRHCHNGLWDYADDEGGREVYGPLEAEIRYQHELINQFITA